MYAVAYAPALRPAPPRRRNRGLGTQQSAGTAVAIGSSVAATGVALAPIGGASSVLAGIVGAAAVPFIGPALAAATLIVSALVKNSGCGQTCIETSQWANQAAAALNQNALAYFAQPTPRSQSSQTLALANYDNIWNQLVTMCSQPSTGNAGKACISDRQAGACKWKVTTPSPWPGALPAGACYNWPGDLRDPIANDPDVAPDASSAVASVESAVSGNLLPILIIGGLLAAAVIL